MSFCILQIFRGHPRAWLPEVDALLGRYLMMMHEYLMIPLFLLSTPRHHHSYPYSDEDSVVGIESLRSLEIKSMTGPWRGMDRKAKGISSMTGSRSDAPGRKISVQLAEYQWLEASRDLTPTPIAETSCPSCSDAVILHVVQAENGSGETHGNVQLN